jgi:hypothetical protein
MKKLLLAIGFLVLAILAMSCNNNPPGECPDGNTGECKSTGL